MAYHTPTQVATRLLLRQPLHGLRFDITRLQFDRTIVFDTFQHFCAVTSATMEELSLYGDVRDGLTLLRQQRGETYHVILYNDDADNLRRRSFTLAHEVAHILLDHREDGDRQEAEANAFAAQLLLPRILVEQLVLLWGSELTAEMVGDVFGASLRAARRSLAALKTPVRYTDDDHALLERFGALLPHPLEPVVTV